MVCAPCVPIDFPPTPFTPPIESNPPPCSTRSIPSGIFAVKYLFGSFSNFAAQLFVQKKYFFPSNSTAAAAFSGTTLIPQTGSRSISSPQVLPTQLSFRIYKSSPCFSLCPLCLCGKSRFSLICLFTAAATPSTPATPHTSPLFLLFFQSLSASLHNGACDSSSNSELRPAALPAPTQSA